MSLFIEHSQSYVQFILCPVSMCVNWASGCVKDDLPGSTRDVKEKGFRKGLDIDCSSHSEEFGS